ncbi:F5/8 type C domain protein [compost metagenome]
MKLKITFAFLLAVCPAFSQLYQVPVYAVTSLQPAQPGAEASQAIDNDDATIYHSKWGQNGIPDELKFYFSSQVSSVKRIIYTPRQSGTNGIWTSVNVYYSTQSNPNTFTLVSGNLSWALDNQAKQIDFATAIPNPYIIKFEVNAGGGNLSSCAEMRFYSENQPTINDGVDCTIPTSGLTLNGANDVEVAIQSTGTTASSFQSGENIDQSFDNDQNTLYHSSYNNTVFPVLLNYRFNGTTPINFLKYIPRSDGGSNGNFGNVTISYNTTGNSTFQTITTFDFGQNGTPTTVQFPTQITPLNIRISVADGYGDFASCAEMEFYTSGPSGSSTPYMNVFTSNLYSQLLPNITQAHIDTISSAFHKNLAQCIFDGTYTNQYRVQAYEVYRPVGAVSNELKIGTYDNFENATGIVFASNEKIALFATNIPSSAPVQLVVKDFQTGFGSSAVSYFELHNGLNVFQLTNGGMAYISYFNNNEQLNDINVNIVSGKVNGYFDRETSSGTDWADLLTSTSYPYIDVRGKYAHLVYDKEALRSGSPFNPLPLICKYDTIVQHERMMMGLFKYNRSPKNRQLTYCEHGGGYYAGGLGVHLDIDWGVSALTDPNQISIWGIAHEYGHINQIRPALNWIGTTEVTNNIYSIWVDYHMDNENDPYTRLEDEDVTPATGIPSITGGRVNGAIYNTYINQRALQDSNDYDVFKVLVPFWQLNIYYSLAGASRNAPILSLDNPAGSPGIDYAHWFGKVAEVARTTSSSGLTNGELLLNFVKNSCDAVEENLIPFFQRTGFLKPIDIPIDDYGVEQLTVTQAQIDDVITYVQGKNYQEPVSPVIHYASAHSVSMFKNQAPLSGITGVGATLNGNYLTVQHSDWHNAVAYETYDTNNELIYVSMSGSGDPSNLQTKVYYPANALAVFAVGYDGHKILVYPASILSVNESAVHSELVIYPNPVGENASIQLTIGDNSGNYTADIVGLDGRSVLKSNGKIETIEETINRNLVHFQSGTYILFLERTNGSRYQAKFVKK